MFPHVPLWAMFLFAYLTSGVVFAFLDKVGLFCFISTGIFICILVFAPHVFPTMSALFMELPWYMKAFFGFGSFFLPHFLYGGLIANYSIWTKPKNNR